MDLKKFSVYIIVVGLLVSLFGISKCVEISNQLSSNLSSISSRNNPFAAFDRGAARAWAKGDQEGPMLIFGAGIVILIIGFGVKHSAKKSPIAPEGTSSTVDAGANAKPEHEKTIVMLDIICPECDQTEQVENKKVNDVTQYKNFEAETKRSFGFLKLLLKCKHCGHHFEYSDRL